MMQASRKELSTLKSVTRLFFEEIMKAINLHFSRRNEINVNVESSELVRTPEQIAPSTPSRKLPHYELKIKVNKKKGKKNKFLARL